jgi:SAM-dependent methyltransferase
LRNQAFQDAGDDYYIQDKTFIFPFIPDRPSVIMDVGCGAGRLGQRLLEFDVAVCGDILEHLKEPRRVIDQIYQWLKPGGLIVCSVPNVRYWRVWQDVIFRGEWKYTTEGIMDQTHLRFFTRRSFRRMLTDASFVIQDEAEHMNRDRAAGIQPTYVWGFQGLFRLSTAILRPQAIMADPVKHCVKERQ